MHDQRPEAASRDARRRERLHAIHEAAYALVTDDGPAAVTVDAIAERAGVSRRTFFNYFATKEDAILGLTPLHIPEAATEDFTSGAGDDFARSAHLLLAIMLGSRLTGQQAVDRRRDLMERFPALAARQRQHSHDAQELVLAALADRESTEAQDENARRRILVLVSGVALRFAAESTLTHLHDLTPHDLDVAVERIRTILQEL